MARDARPAPVAQTSVVLGFAVGAAAMMAANQIVAVLVLRFLTDNLAISAGIAAALFAAVKIYDGLVDPFAGYISDRTHGPLGRRLPYLLVAAILMPIAIVGIFAVPDITSRPLLLAWIGGMLALHGTAFSFYSVPSAAMIVEASDDYHARSTILAWKTYGGFAGQILGSSLPPWLLQAWGADRAGHAAMSWVIAGMIFVLAISTIPMLRPARATAGTIAQRARASGEAAGKGITSFFDQLTLARHNKPFCIMVFVHIIFMVGVATASVSNAYFTRYVLERDDTWLGLFYVFLTAGNIAAVPFWLRLSRRYDKKNTYILALGLYGTAVLSWIIAGPHETLFTLGLRVTVIGATMSGVVLLAASMLTDAVRYDYIRSGERREGAFSGYMSFIDKMSNAAGLVLMGAILSTMGYASSNIGAQQTQDAGAVWAIRICFAVIPALAPLLSIFLLQGYTLKEEDLVEGVRPRPDDGTRASAHAMSDAMDHSPA